MTIKLSRREVLSGLTSGALLMSVDSLAGAKHLESIVSSGGNSEYMLAPGLNYLNTASLGPTPRRTLDKVLKAWYELELNPVRMAYGYGASLVATDKAREQVAALIGCSADELLITRSATDAMNNVAFGIDLERGDRVLTTDVEHEGGSAGWKYLNKYRGVEMDFIQRFPKSMSKPVATNRSCRITASSEKLAQGMGGGVSTTTR